jgi:hypothetical protein
MANWVQNHFNECVADLKMPDGWEDVSYGNDACPSWAVNGYQIFIDHPIPEKRECRPCPRFHVHLESQYGEGDGWGIITDSWDEVLETIEKPLYCEWNAGEIKEVHSEQSLYENYKHTNLYDGEPSWGDGYNFTQILSHLKNNSENIGRELKNDNMSIRRMF